MSRFRISKIKKLEKFLLKKSPYYSEMITANGGLMHLPIIDKKTYFENFNEINTVGIKYKEAMEVALKAESSRDFSPTIGNIAVGLSSGTSGNRGLFITNSEERNHWVAAMLYKVIGLKFKKRKVAFFLRSNNQLYENSNSGLIQFTYFDLSRPLEVLLDQLNMLQPDILIAQPSVLAAISAAQNQKNIDIRPEKIISVAEVLEDDVKYDVSTTFGQLLHQVYQCTEGFLAATCVLGNLHLNEDLVFFQERWLDEDKSRFHPVITDLYRRSQPMVRYELNDVLTYDSELCICGNPSRVIKKIDGRHDDVLIFKLKTISEYKMVFGDHIRRLMLIADKEEIIENYQVNQEDENTLTISLAIKNNADPDVLKSVIFNEFLSWFEKHNLQLPQISFKETIIFDPMKKFRRISRANFSYPINTAYL